MNSLSIKMKLITLSAALLTLLASVAGVEYYGIIVVSEKLNVVSDVELPAVRTMTLIDMMHDGLRAVAFRALYVSSSLDLKEKEEVAAEMREFVAAMKKHIQEIDQLPLPAATKLAIEEAKPEINVYLEMTEGLVTAATEGRRSVAISKLAEFQVAFKSLEGKLEKLGDLIEKEAEASQIESHSQSSKFKAIALGLVLLSVLIGVFLSVSIVRDLTSNLNGVVSRLTEASSQVSNASMIGATSASQFGEASARQAASLQETVAAAEEISSTVSQNADSAERAKQAVEENQLASQEGASSATSMMDSIVEIREINASILDQMLASNRELSEIVSIISRIEEKTKVINDIVFQTKLLSFNASVESARAGEQGKGFAVVAAEVGSLAQMSGSAAKDISEMLTDSIKRVNEIVDGNKSRTAALSANSKSKIEAGQAKAEDCRGALEKIEKNASRITAMISEIVTASREQAIGVQQINVSIGQLDEVTHQNSLSAQEGSKQAEHLKVESKRLDETVKILVSFLNGSNGGDGFGAA